MNRDIDSKDIDSRVISFNQDLSVGGPLESIAKIVSEDDDLELCYRGNSKPENITIYMHNHIVLRIEKYKRDDAFKLTVSINHIDEKIDMEKKRSIYDKFEFSSKFEDSYWWKKVSVMDYQEVLELIKEMKRAISKFFENTHSFLNNEKVERKNDFHIEAEKVRQQELFTLLNNTENGYFIYDLEFARPYKDAKAANIAKMEGVKNKPDFLALKFANRESSTLVLGEVKTMKGSCEKGSASMNEHLRKMISVVKPTAADDKKFLNNRKVEAVGLFNDYKDANLRGLEKDKDYKIEIDQYEIMLIFTDETIRFAEDYKVIADQYKNSEELNNCSISVWTYNPNDENQILKQH